MLAILLIFIGLSVTLVWYFLGHDHGRKLPIGSLWNAVGFGVLALVLAVLIERTFLPKGLLDNPGLYSQSTRLWGLLGVGATEEAAKFVPLAFFIWRKQYFQEHTDGVIYFAVAGLTFGLVENILYTLQFGVDAGLLRLALTPFLHASSTSILGYYLAGLKINRAYLPRFVTVCVAIPLAHGIYDYGLVSGIPLFVLLSLAITLLLAVMMFVYFSHANRLDSAAAVRVRVSTENFCPHCGQPNRAHKNFCVYCGKPL